MMNRPEIAENYFHHLAYLSDPFLRHPDLLPAGITIWEDLPKNGFEEYLTREAKTFNLDMGFMFIEKNASQATIFSVAASKENGRNLSYFINNFSLFRRFFQYYINEIRAFVEQPADNAIDLISLLNKDFFEPSFPSYIKNDKQYRFMQQITGQKIHVKFLTPREKQCLNALLEGLTAKQTASILNLSVRTVEHFLEEIKQKLNCTNKSALFQKAQELELFGMLKENFEDR
ncbi:MAG: helix-turn-helix transcriptional regulator [Legionellales bacterium]|nr:helix-turn-helix transcriptional regulator [Legionellales bacterium]